MNASDIKALLLLTFRSPTQVVHALRAMNLPMASRWLVLILAVSLSAILAWLSTKLFPVDLDTAFTRMTAQPMVIASAQFVIVVLTAWLMASVGRAFGGTGDFPDALLLVTWIEFVLLVIQSAQVIMMILFPAIGALLSLLAVVVFVGLFVLFTKALHGFQSTAKVVFGIVGTFLAVGFVLSIIGQILGIIPEVPV